MTLRDKRPILGVDPTPRGLAFVSFEDGIVQDWGTRLVRDISDATDGLDALFRQCGTEVLVIENSDAPGCIRRPRLRLLLRQLDHHAGRHGIEVVTVPRVAVNDAWCARGAMNKYAIAQEIGKQFPELAPLVPKVRRHYEIEPGRVHLFDAASLVLHVIGIEEHQAAA